MSIINKPWIQQCILVIVGTVLSFVLAEVVLRLWTPSSLQFKRARRSNPVIHHSLVPSTFYVDNKPEFSVEVRVNSLGLRDHEYELSDTSSFRIIVLGDSFTEGVGVPVDSVFAKRLERLLNHPHGTNVSSSVFNFGLSGYSPILEFLALREKGIALKPRLVILFYDMTDVQEDVLYAEDAEFDSAGVPLKVHPSWPSFGNETRFPRSEFKTYLQEKSYLYTLVVSAFNRVKPPPKFEPGDINSSRFVHTIDSTAERWVKYFDQSESYVRMIRDLCASKGITFVLVAFPRGHQVGQSEWAIGRKYWGLDSVTRNSAIFSSLQSFADHNAIPFLNMTPVFRARSKGNLYFPFDGHWTSEGHAVAADTLFSFLYHNHLIPN